MDGKLKKYGYALCAGVLFFGVYWFTHLLPEGHSTYELICTLANGFTVPGVILVGAGGLSWCASKGAFDLFSYGASMTFGRFLPLGKKNVFHSGEKYYDYVERKRENRKAWLKEWLLIGVAMVAVALVLTLVSHLV